ncbi:MAG: hypothetical protein CTY18_04125 [Methylomonas sp.]|nr:MAG: hypothetical protein CTY18_04125 [Methylomonas sp.]
MFKIKSFIAKIFAITTVGFATNGCAAVLTCENRLVEAAIPQNAFFLPENDATQLQKALDTHTSIRLVPGGNYRRSFAIKLSSNQSIYGLAGTKLPAITVSEGTTNTLISGVSPEKIVFTGSNSPIQGNCLNRITNSKLQINNAIFVNNLIIDLEKVPIDINTSQKGYIKGNRFIRTMVHGSYPAIKLIGDSAKQSQDNLFVWTNILTPHGDGIIIKNQKNISFIGIDAESWNWSKKATYPGMMNVMDTDFISILMSNGGDNRSKLGQYYNLDAKKAVLLSTRIGPTQKPGIILGSHVEKLLTIDARDIGLTKSNQATQVIDIYKNSNPVIVDNKQTIQPENIAPSTRDAINNLLNIDKAVYDAWKKPVFEAIPDPAGAQWQVNLSKQPDSSDAIQKLIDQNGIAQLNAGIYYISKPLKLKKNQGIIGVGATKTAIVAKSPNIDMIIGDDRINFIDGGNTTSFVLADLTLQGGRNGIYHYGSTAGKGADYVGTQVSHVTFRNMTNAGIFMDGIYAWDNNFVDYTIFYRCKIGIKQRVDPNYPGGNAPGITFLDKNVFYQSQFVENDIALEWQAQRGNNLNAFVNSLFKNNTQTLIFNNSDSTFFANSIFETSSDQPLLKSNRLVGFFNSYFTGKNASALFKDNALCNHCVFENTAANSSQISLPTGKSSYYINSTMTKPTTQTMDTGLIANSNFSTTTSKPANLIFDKKIAKPF